MPGLLLACPDDARDPDDVRDLQYAIAMLSVERFELYRFRGLALELFDHNLALAGLDHDTVALAYRGARRDDDDVTVAIRRLHRIAGNFQRIGVFVGNGRKSDLFPAFADRKSAVIKKTADASLRKTNERDVTHRWFAAIGDQGNKRIEFRVCCLQRFGHRLRRRPARPAFRCHALGLVEGS